MDLRQKHDHCVFGLRFQAGQLGVSARAQLARAAEEVEEAEVVPSLLRRFGRGQAECRHVEDFVFVPAGARGDTSQLFEDLLWAAALSE